jgi:hypothetical protein
VRVDRDGLRTICHRCHDPQGERITPLLVCWFETRQELARGPYGGRRQCVDCHLPRTRRRLSALFTEYPERHTAQHHWVGGGIPKDYAGYDTLLSRGWRPGLDATLLSWRAVPVSATSPDGTPAAAARKVRFTLAVTNARAGHALPTADPERHLLLQAELLDEGGERLSRATHRIGQRWRWEPRAEKLSDNRLAPGETRRWGSVLAIPVGSPAPARLRITILHVRLNSDTARYLQQHARTRDTYVPGSRRRVQSLARHYPLASYVYRVDVDLGTGARRRLGRAALIALSKAEQGKALDERDY